MADAVQQIVDAFMRRVSKEHDDLFDMVVVQYLKCRRDLLVASRAVSAAKRTGVHNQIRYAEFIDDVGKYISFLVDMRAKELAGITREVCAASHAAHLLAQSEEQWLAQSEEQWNDIAVSIQPDAVRVLDKIRPRDLVPPSVSIMEYRAAIIFNVLYNITNVRRELRQIRNEPASKAKLLALSSLSTRLVSTASETTWLVAESVDAVRYSCLVYWGYRLKCFARKTRDALDAMEGATIMALEGMHYEAE